MAEIGYMIREQGVGGSNPLAPTTSINPSKPIRGNPIYSKRGNREKIYWDYERPTSPHS